MDELINLLSQIQPSESGSSILRGIPYQPLPKYLNLDGEIPCQKRDTVLNEYSIIKSFINRKRSVIDIGANIGYFSFMLAYEMQCKCLAIDADSHNVAIMNEINRLSKQDYGLSIEVSDTVPTYCACDYLLMLNVHHWIHKVQGSRVTKSIMRDVSANSDVMFFQTAHAESRSHYKVEELKNQHDIEAYLHEVGWRYVICLGSTQPDEPRYLFYCHH